MFESFKERDTHVAAFDLFVDGPFDLRKRILYLRENGWVNALNLPLLTFIEDKSEEWCVGRE
jgi:hypothetical protein